MEYFNPNMNGYYTHQEYIKRILDILLMHDPLFNLKVNVLEFGSGDGSSIVFNEYANKYKDILTVQSFEHVIDWYEKMKSKYSLSNYTFNLVDWAKFDYTELKKEKYDFVFVDQGIWEERIRTIDELKDCTKIFILHDYCYYNGFRQHTTPYQDMPENSVGKGTYFYEKYNDEFELIPETSLYPPTLIFKKR